MTEQPAECGPGWSDELERKRLLAIARREQIVTPEDEMARPTIPEAKAEREILTRLLSAPQREPRTLFDVEGPDPRDVD